MKPDSSMVGSIVPTSAPSIATRCDGCIGFHTEALVKLGASRQELDETLGVVVYMGGGPALMCA